MLREARLLLARRLPSCNLCRLASVLTPLGVVPVVSGTAPFVSDRAASDQGPCHLTDTYGVVAARRPPMEQTVQHRTYRNLCCTGHAVYVPAWHLRIVLEVNGICDPCLHEESRLLGDVNMPETGERDQCLPLPTKSEVTMTREGVENCSRCRNRRHL